MSTCPPVMLPVGIAGDGEGELSPTADAACLKLPPPLPLGVLECPPPTFTLDPGLKEGEGEGDGDNPPPALELCRCLPNEAPVPGRCQVVVLVL